MQKLYHYHLGLKDFNFIEQLYSNYDASGYVSSKFKLFDIINYAWSVYARQYFITFTTPYIMS